jgi:glycosyltransferase involved in cell wall biosynthesis
MKKILLIVPSPKKIAPSARFRIELYEDFLAENGFECTSNSFWSEETTRVLYKSGNFLRKFLGVLQGVGHRLQTLFHLHQYDYILIHRETMPLGPPVFEWIYAKLFKKKIIYDFDDAIWVNQAYGSNAWVRPFKSFWKIKAICRWSYRVSVGNRYLYNYAVQYNPAVIVNPTCVDTVHRHNVLKEQNTERIVIGWTGSFSLLMFLNEVIDVLQALERKYDFDFIVIADKDPQLPLKNFQYIKWTEATEITDLLKFNIGIMPLPDDEFTRGKCGFKLIQYMSVGIPVVASPVEVNSIIVDQGETGFLCTTNEQWYDALEKLLTDLELRREMGRKGREKIIRDYSKISNGPIILSLFK